MCQLYQINCPGGHLCSPVISDCYDFAVKMFQRGVVSEAERAEARQLNGCLVITPYVVVLSHSCSCQRPSWTIDGIRRKVRELTNQDFFVVWDWEAHPNLEIAARTGQTICIPAAESLLEKQFSLQQQAAFEWSRRPYLF